MLLFAILQVLNLPLITSAAPFASVSDQLAWKPEKAQAILASWGARADLLAAFGLGLDYLFMPCYALVAALGSLLASDRHAGWFSPLGVWAAYGVFVGMLFDVLENVGQAVQSLNGKGTALQTIAVGICASFKFSLLLLCILYGLVGWILPKKER